MVGQMVPLAALVAAVLTTSGGMAMAAEAPALTCYVSAKGDDACTGRRAKRSRADGPVRTLQHARDLVRQWRAGAGGAQPARIVVGGGEYYLDQPLLLEAQDSHLSIEAAPGERVVLYGGRRVMGWEKDGDALWSAELPGVRAGECDFRLLVVDGAFCRRARLPEKGVFEHLTEFKVPWMSTTGGGWQRKPTPAELTTLRYRPGDLGPWLDVRNAELTVYHLWDESVVGLATLDEATQTVTFCNPAGHPPGAFGVKKYVVWNVREGMRAPGQWYLDRTAGKVFYWPLPGQRMEKAVAIAPTAESVLLLRGSKEAPTIDVVVKGLHLSVTTTPLKAGGFGANNFAGAVTATYTRDCRLSGLTIFNTGGQGVKAWESDGLRIEGCHIHDTGACGITARGQGVVVADNLIHRIGVTYPSAIALSVGGKGCEVSHNEVHDCPYSAITAGGDDHRIEGNLIYRAMQELHDGAGIYITFCKRVVVRGNVVRDVAETGGPGSSAYYLDEQAEECLVEGNLAVRIDRATQNHMAKRNTLRGNVFIATGDMKLTFPKSAEYTLAANVVYAGGKITVGNPGAVGAFHDNLFFSGAGAYEGLPADVLRADPLFTDLAGDVWTFRPGSPAVKLGICPVDVRSAGRRR